MRRENRTREEIVRRVSASFQGAVRLHSENIEGIRKVSRQMGYHVRENFHHLRSRFASFVQQRRDHDGDS